MRFSECRSVFPCSVAVLLAEAGGKRRSLSGGVEVREIAEAGHAEDGSARLALFAGDDGDAAGQRNGVVPENDRGAVEQAREKHAFDAEVAEQEQVFRVRTDGGGRGGRRARSRASPAGASRPSVTRAVDRRRRRNPGRPEPAASARGRNSMGSCVQVFGGKSQPKPVGMYRPAGPYSPCRIRAASGRTSALLTDGPEREGRGVSAPFRAETM